MCFPKGCFVLNSTWFLTSQTSNLEPVMAFMNILSPSTASGL